MGLSSNNDDAMNKIPLKSVSDDEEKNGGDFIHDTATAEEARREQRRVKLLNLMKKLTIGIICFIGIALISYVIISLCFSEWPKSQLPPNISSLNSTRNTNNNSHNNNRKFNSPSSSQNQQHEELPHTQQQQQQQQQEQDNFTTATTSSFNSNATIPLSTTTTATTSSLPSSEIIASNNNPFSTTTTTTTSTFTIPPTATPISLPSTFTKSSFLSDDTSNNNNNKPIATSSSGKGSSNININNTLAASFGLSHNSDENDDDEEVEQPPEHIATATESTLPTTMSTADATTSQQLSTASSTSVASSSASSAATSPMASPATTATTPSKKFSFKDMPLIEKHFNSTLGVYQNAAVCSDKHVCSQIGSNILQEDGSAVDSAIAALLCTGIVAMQSMGIGGGMMMNVYIKSEQQAYSIDGREVASFASTEDMFNSDPQQSLNTALGIAVPGELMGYYRAHEKFGKLPWKKLVEPSLEICKQGFYMSAHQHMALLTTLKWIKKDAILSKVYMNETSGHIHPIGTKLQPPKELCNTYEILAEKGPLDFYNGTLARLVAADLKEMESTVTLDDLEAYRADLVSSVTMQLGNDILYAVPPVSSGTVVSHIMSILEGFNFTKADFASEEKKALAIHRMVEALKFGFAKRWELGDVRFNDVRELVSRLTNPENAIELRKKINDSSIFKSVFEYGAQFSGEDDYGTSPMVIMAPNGDAVAVTSSVNQYFGSVRVGKQTGIVFNNAMDDFSIPGASNSFGLPPSPANFISAQKRPMSSMSPMILADQQGNVRLAISAAGGSYIISSLVLVMSRILWLNENIKQAIDAPRFHHQLLPSVLTYQLNEKTYFSEELINLLSKKGHKMEPMKDLGSVVCGIVKNATAIYANADYRKQGGTAGF